MTREAALRVVSEMRHHAPRYLQDQAYEAMVILSLPVIELEGWEVVRDEDPSWAVVYGDAVGDRVIILRRKA